MIEVEIEFHPGALKQIVGQLLSLPAALRPSLHSLGEDEKGLPIIDPQQFADSVEERLPAPFLTGRHCTYYFRLADSRAIVCCGDIDVEPTLVKQFMLEMASLNPFFGFACLKEERYQRNRVTTQQGVNTIESWVGRDTQRYVPGFYWLTLLPESLAKRHGVSLSEVEKVSLEHIELVGGQHLFRFYDRPEDWQATSAVAELCASLPGVFDVEKIKPRLPAAKNFLELNAMLRNWK